MTLRPVPFSMHADTRSGGVGLHRESPVATGGSEVRSPSKAWHVNEACNLSLDAGKHVMIVIRNNRNKYRLHLGREDFRLGFGHGSFSSLSPAAGSCSLASGIDNIGVTGHGSILINGGSDLNDVSRWSEKSLTLPRHDIGDGVFWKHTSESPIDHCEPGRYRYGCLGCSGPGGKCNRPEHRDRPHEEHAIRYGWQLFVSGPTGRDVYAHS